MYWWMANDDMELVRQYAAHRSEAAFETLVSRHLNLVYSAAVRRVGDAHLAGEITQAVFIILARKAAALGPDTILPSWLHRTAGYVAADALKARRRRARREQEAFMQSALNEPETETWPQIAPLLDAAMDGLNEKDRRALVLRFFQNQSLHEIGAATGTSEEAAKKRVSRALEKLRHFFLKSGVSSTTAAIAGAISANSVQVAPLALAKAVTTAALAQGATASASTLTLIKGALKIMAWTKAKTVVIAAAVLLFAAGTTTITWKIHESRAGYYQGKTLTEWLVDLDDQHPGPKYDHARAAVLHFGTNGLPTIVSKFVVHGQVYHNAINACYELGPLAKPAIPELIKVLNSGFTRGYIGAALGRIGPEAIPPLLDALTNRTESVRTEVVSSLGNFSGRESIQMSNAIPGLIACLKDESPFVRSSASRSLGFMGLEPASVVPALTAALNDTDIQAKWCACLALGEFGRQAESSIPALSAALHDPSPSVCGTAAIALVQIAPDDSSRITSLMPLLIENVQGIGGTNTNFRYPTIEALALCGAQAKPAIPALVAAADKNRKYEYDAILRTLKRIDPKAAAGLK